MLAPELTHALALTMRHDREQAAAAAREHRAARRRDRTIRPSATPAGPAGRWTPARALPASRPA